MERSRLDALICKQELLQHLTRRDIEEIQLRKLNSLLSREKQRGGFYRELPEFLPSLEKLSELPFTEEKDLAAFAPGLMLTSQRDISRVISGETSGTTGMPKRVFYTERDLENTIALYTAGLGELIFPGNRVMICFPFSGPNGLGELIAEAIRRLEAVPLKTGAFLSYREYRETMDREKPDCFVGMPVQLLSILRACGKGTLRRALVSGDSCPRNVISAAEQILGSSLFPHYGSREMGMAGAITCPAHSGMHLRENCIIAEIIDDKGRPLPHGQWGELVITTIGMEALPLIRYKTGDYTRIIPGACPCGSETVRLDQVVRAGEPDQMHQLDNAVFSIPEMVDFCSKTDGENIRIDVLTTGKPDLSAVAEAVAKVFPQKSITVQGRMVQMSDRPLYMNKRRILYEKKGRYQDEKGAVE